MHVAENPAGMGVSPEIDQVETGVAVDQLDQLTSGITGSSKNRRADTPEMAVYAYANGRGASCVVRDASIELPSVVGARNDGLRDPGEAFHV
jgi:hypothetical protein